MVTLLDLGTRDMAPLFHHEALMHADAGVTLGMLPQLVLHAAGAGGATGYDLRTGKPVEHLP